MKDDYLRVECPYCRTVFSLPKLKQHRCERNQYALITKQDWWVARDKALAAAGKPEMIYGYHVEFIRSCGEAGSFRFAGTEAAARRKAILQSRFKAVRSCTPFTYAQYCRAFGIPGSKM